MNTLGGRYGNALQAAAKGVHLDIIQLVLETGADVNARGEEYGNTLNAQCCGDNLSI